ncbi:uncharacterized protein SCHCODRAFT_02614519 [Schizophyllum commune H4-8]|uniref:uncharacterized protein n=1 Tax=Schizophyllum commune (strain H4-8 / FGSC 9210) TaxID=578458 RepID=UPI00215E8C3B|nr:uncharacterized protein SCHCODRAFT_02614519 [Schizophyllum commune H4-8]KAI5896305.1 hypothetical protein SCHCODRAFT_02614519 [Schizophyllum commune H4-8]
MSSFKLTLPAELLHDILAPVIDSETEDQEFRSCRSIPYENSGARWRYGNEALRAEERRPPALLLVCKAWNRIGTPLLYRTIILRSKGQAEVLARTLTTLAPDLGSSVRRLRLEGGYGRVVLQILKATTRVSELVLVLSLRSDDSISGLVRGLALPAVNPAEIRLICEYEHDLKKRKTLVQTLAEAFKGWSNLKKAHIPWITDGRNGQGTVDFISLLEGLATTPSLQIVVLPREVQKHDRFFAALKTLATNRALRCIDMSRHAQQKNALDKAIASDPRLRAVCKYEDPATYRPSTFIALRRAFRERAMNPPPPREPTPEPLAATPPASGRTPIQEQPLEVQERVWCRVFDFAQMHSSYEGRCTAERLMGVCRLWRRLLFVRLYTNAKPQDWYGAVLLGDACRIDPSLGRHVRTLELCNKVERDLYVPLNAVVNNMPNLSQIKSQGWRRDSPRRFATPPTLFIEWGEFAGLAKSAEGLEVIGGVQVRKKFVGKEVGKRQPGATKGVATRSRVNAPTTPVASAVDPAAPTAEPSDAARHDEQPDEARHSALKEVSVPVGSLTPFRALRVLHFGASVKLKFKDGAIDPAIFPVLEDLEFEPSHTSVLRLFSILELPRLRRLALHGRSQTAEHAAHFLENHGPKIEELELAYFPTEVIFESCMHMKRLRIEADRPPENYSASEWTSTSLETVISLPRPPSHGPTLAQWGAFLSSLDPARLPQLKEIRVQKHWPTHERAIKKSVWVAYAEELQDKGIQIVDSSGLPWVRRAGVRSRALR